MLNLFRQSDEADLERILAQHAAVPDEAGSREKQFRDLLQALPAAIYTTDADGRITFFNRACIEFAGRTPKIGVITVGYVTPHFQSRALRTVALIEAANVADINLGECAFSNLQKNCIPGNSPDSFLLFESMRGNAVCPLPGWDRE
jgi:PAS domain-containing protein